MVRVVGPRRFAQARKPWRPACLTALAIGVLASWLAGCGESDPPPRPIEFSPPPRSVAPRPESVIGELFVADPNRVLERVRALDPDRLLPRSIGMLAVLILGLEPAAAGLIDGDAPMVGALVAGQAGAGAILGLRTTSPREMRARLCTGVDAGYRAEERGAVVTLEPRESRSRPSLALAGDYLLVTRRADDAIDVGAYLARTVAERERPPHDLQFDVAGARMGPALAAALGAEWTSVRAWLEQTAVASREAHGGQQADRADPEAVIRVLDGTFGHVMQIFRDAERARAFLDVNERVTSAGVAVDVSAGTPSGSALDAVPAGGVGSDDFSDQSPAFLVASAGLGVGEMLTAATVEILGSRLPRKEEGALREAGAMLDEAFDGPVTLARLPADDDDWAWALTGKPRSADRFDGAVRSLDRVLGFRAMRALLPARSTSATPSPKTPGMTRAHVVGAVHDGAAVCVLTSGDPHRLLTTLENRSRTGDTFVSMRLDALGPSPLAAAALRLASADDTADPGWAVIAAGRRDRQVYVQLDAEPSAARALLSIISGD